MLRRTALLSLVAVLVACKPATPEQKFRSALGWTDVEDVRKLLDAGQDANHAFEDGDKPVHVVAQSMHATGEMMRLLLDRGADVDATDADGRTAWELRWGKDGARRENDAAVLLALLDHGFAPPTGKGEDGKTLLHEVAATLPSARMVTVLVDKHGYDVNVRDDNGWTPLHHAVAENNAQAATGLLEKGADANAQSTKTVGLSFDKGGTEVWRWRYEKGSQPLDVFSLSNVGRFDEDVRKVLDQYGATKNPAVDNRPK